MFQGISDRFCKAEARITETRQFIRDVKLYIQNILLMGAHRTQVYQQR
jgi:hypothetical protein